MDQTGDRITLFTAQREVVIEELMRDGVCHSRERYVREKYGAEVYPVYRECYGWYVKAASEYVPRPDGEPYPYWAFQHSYNLELSGNVFLMELSVPRTACVFFDVDDWRKVLCLEYMDPDPVKERAYKEELSLRGLRSEDVMLGGFYPEQKREILLSWNALFHHHERIVNGDMDGVLELQAGLWEIRKEWVRKIYR